MVAMLSFGLVTVIIGHQEPMTKECLGHWFLVLDVEQSFESLVLALASSIKFLLLSLVMCGDT